VVLAPAALPPAEPRARGAGCCRPRLAAGFVAVAAVVVVLPPCKARPPAGTQIAATPPPTAGRCAGGVAAARRRHRRQSLLVIDGQVIRDARVDAYLERTAGAVGPALPSAAPGVPCAASRSWCRAVMPMRTGALAGCALLCGRAAAGAWQRRLPIAAAPRADRRARLAARMNTPRPTAATTRARWSFRRRRDVEFARGALLRRRPGLRAHRGPGRQAAQVYRHNDLVHTVWPQAGVAVIERRSLPSRLPSTTQSVEPRALDQYELRPEGRDRVAGREARCFLLQPRDDAALCAAPVGRPGTGLMLRADVIGPDAGCWNRRVLRGRDRRARAARIGAAAAAQARRAARAAAAQSRRNSRPRAGRCASPVPGFQLAGCVKRPADPRSMIAGARGMALQAVFSDGLTHVSLFIEPVRRSATASALRAQFGATHTLMRGVGEHWITAMGDVPPATLEQFVDALERRP
jgi:sigma-E factor negative regulatory protein RseB